MISIDKAKSIIYFTQPGRDGEVWIWWDDSAKEFIYTFKSQASGKTVVKWLSSLVYDASTGVPLMDEDPSDPRWKEDRIKWVMGEKKISKTGDHAVVEYVPPGASTTSVGLYHVKDDYLIILYLKETYGLEWNIINLKSYDAKYGTLSGLEKL